MSVTDARLFISHSSQDSAWCQEFVAALRAAGYTCFFDHDSIPGSTEWLGTIQEGVQQCDLCVLILSPVAWASPWVKREWQLALRLNKPILPVEYQPTAAANGGFLGQFQWVKVGGLAAATAAQLAKAELARLGYGAAPKHRHGVIAAPPLSPSSFPIPTRLARLGFVGSRRDGVEVIVPPLCDVAAGTFTMGSDTQHDTEAGDDEIPQYDIFVPAFQIGIYPLTVAEYACAVGAGAVTEPQPYVIPKDAHWAAAALRGTTISWQTQQLRADHPVVCLSLPQARAYAAWLTKMTGQNWRLPTEAEWEKAARGTDGRIYPWGNQWEKEKANTDTGGPQTTTPIGDYAAKGDASPYGAHDLAGNVWEWTSSVYVGGPPYRVDQSEKDADTTSRHVLRGGSWYDLHWFARAAFRYVNIPGYIACNIGARLVRGFGAGT